MHTLPKHITELSYIYATTTEQRPSEANRPTLPKMPSAARWKERLALSIEHLNFLDRVTKTPRERISSTQDIVVIPVVLVFSEFLLISAKTAESFAPKNGRFEPSKFWETNFHGDTAVNE